MEIEANGLLLDSLMIMKKIVATFLLHNAAAVEMTWLTSILVLWSLRQAFLSRIMLIEIIRPTNQLSDDTL